MQRQTVTSSNIKSIGYDPEKKILEIEFKRKDMPDEAGPIYQYEGFTAEDWGGFRQASSIGRYFAKNIRNQFVTKKIEAAPDADTPQEKTQAPKP